MDEYAQRDLSKPKTEKLSLDASDVDSFRYFLPQGVFDANSDSTLSTAQPANQTPLDTLIRKHTSRIDPLHFMILILCTATIEDYFNLDAEFLQLSSFSDRSVKSSQFTQFAETAHQRAQSKEGDSKQQQESSIDALLLAAECHLNPYFIARLGSDTTERVQQLNEPKSTADEQKEETKMESFETDSLQEYYEHQSDSVPTVSVALEENRDTEVMKLLIRAAQWHVSYNDIKVEESQPLQVQT